MNAEFVAVVLAGDRTEKDPVAFSAGVSCKAITPIAGKAMILRVLDALEASPYVKSIVLCGPPEKSIAECRELELRLQSSAIRWLANENSPSRSVEAALADIASGEKVLLTTADHALLRPEIVDDFLQTSLQTEADATVALVKYETIRKAFPSVKRTVLQLGQGGLCSCNLFTFLNSSGRGIVPIWRRVEQKRKKPALMITGLLGVWGVLRYLLGKLEMKSAFDTVSNRLGIRIKAVILEYPEAGVDVDTPEDKAFVESQLSSPG